MEPVLADSLFTELKRRNVFKVGFAYLVLAWVVVQVTQAAVPALRLPEWVNSLVFFLGAIGFPFAVLLAWAFEITPEGVKRENEVDRSESVTPQTGRKIDFFIIGIMAIAIVYFVYDRQTRDSKSVTNSETAVQQDNSYSKPEKKTTTENVELEGSSIAVLPFINMSQDKNNEYFSDGISEEILNLLAKIPKLHVTSRSSAFSFKGKEIIISDIAKKLGVSNILEGSVRKSGNRIRITAQLISAETDKHLWSETYDREMTDIFKIQDEIAAAIVKALKSNLGLEIKIQNREMTGINLEAHNEYLRGRFYLENRTKEDIETALHHFEKAINIAPDYAPAWMGKAWAITFLSETNYGVYPTGVANERAKPAAEKALLLDPRLPEAHAIMGLILDNAQRNEEAIPYFERAIALNPNYTDVYTWYGNALINQPLRQMQLREKAYQLAPMSIISSANYGFSLTNFGRYGEANSVANHILEIDSKSRVGYVLLAEIYLDQGQSAQAAFYLTKAKKYGTALTDRFLLASNLANLGLINEGVEVLEGTAFEVFGLILRSNNELFISQTRALFPRSDSDLIGAFARALAEFKAKNYKEAIQYYKQTVCDQCEELIYSYIQVGDTDFAKALLDKKRSNYQKIVTDGVINQRKTAIIVANLEGNIVKTLTLIEEELNKGVLIDRKFKVSQIYEKLRQHPKWPALLARSNQLSEQQKEIYLRLIAEDETNTKV